MGIDWTSNAPDGSYLMGADGMGGALMYFYMVYYRSWAMLIFSFFFDLTFYGPQWVGGMWVAAVIGFKVL